MPIRSFISILTVAALLAFGVFCVAAAIFESDLPQGFADLPEWSDRSVNRQLSQNSELKQIAPTMLLTFGAQEQDGIFITEDYLLENIAPPDKDHLNGNLNAIKRFLENHNTHTAVVLIPTACVIKQQDLPASANLFNQKELISDCYYELSGLASTVDAYSQLFSAKNQYTYYRTESLPTGLGGYYIYNALTSRLGITTRPLDQFEVENLPYDYYGSLYQRSSFKSVSPDLITLYRFSRFSRQYKLTLTENGEQKSYFTLFPTHLSELGQHESVIFGGFGERMDISVASPYENSLLIFADKTALCYLPFLVVHYGNITMIDLASCSEEQLEQIDIDAYDQVLFSYSVDNFMHKDVCSSAANIK